MNIILVVKNLSGGGAEKVAVELANHLVKNHDVTIMTLSNTVDRFIPDTSIKRINLSLYSRSRNILEGLLVNLTRVFSLRKEILSKNPDVVITYMNRTNIRVLMSLYLSKIPIIITEHNYPKDNPMKGIWEILRRVYYKKAFKLVSVSRGISDWFTFLPKGKKVVIYNPANIYINNSNEYCLDLTKKNIVAMGRLVDIKGFDNLIKAFSEIYMLTPNWNLSIIGDGKLYDELNNLIIDRKLTDRVFLLGFKSEPHNILEKSDLFVLSSKSEGLGNVIIEAMKCGVPVLSTNCPVGPKELIEHNKTGILVDNDNIHALSNGLLDIISNDNKRIELRDNALKHIDRFSNDKIFLEWDKLLSSIKERS